MTFPELPYEIWLHITSFLDHEARCSLYSVNRSLFDIAMNERYYHALIGRHSKTTMTTAFPWVEIRDPSSAARVRLLVVKLPKKPPYESKKSSIPRNGLNGLWNITKRGLPSWDVFGTAIDLVPFLTSVNELRIDDSIMSNRDFQFSIPKFLQMGWSVYGSSLRTLVLSLPLDELPLILQHEPKLPHLEKLDFLLRTSPSISNSDVLPLVKKTILPFIQNHREALTEITIRGNPLTESDLMSPFFSLLPYMPHLVTFRLFHSISSPDRESFEGHERFLEAHRLQLQNLTFSLSNGGVRFPYQEDGRFTQLLLRFRFPKLETLRLALPGHVASITGAATQHLKQSIHTVASLDFQGRVFRYDSLLSVFSDVEGFSRLRHLSLCILSANSDVLRLFAENLPCLHTLNLDASNFRAENHVYMRASHNKMINDFCKAMESTVYPKWKIDSLWITAILNLHDQSPEKELVKRVLFAAFPNLQVLCGERRL